LSVLGALCLHCDFLDSRRTLTPSLPQSHPGAPSLQSFYLKLAAGHLRLSVCMCSAPMGRPRSGRAHGLHRQTNGLRDGPDFRRIPTTNVLRTCMHARIKSIQIGERRSARPSNCSPALQYIKLVQSEIHRERPEFRRAAEREGVEFSALARPRGYVSTSGAARGRRAERLACVPPVHLSV